MAWLNRILWLKCRLTERAYNQAQGGRLATLLMAVFVFGGTALFAVFVGLQLAVRPPQEVRELLHIALALIHMFWISFPLFGYRLNESMDVTRLFLYPISGFTIFLATFAGNLLELPTLLVYPVLLGISVALCPDWAQVLPALGILVLFLLQTIAMSQLLLSLLLNSLKDRKMSDRMMILLPLMAACAVWALEFGIFVSGAGEVLLRLELSRFTVWFGPGIASEALLALAGGRSAAFLWHTAVLAGLTLATIYLAARANEWLMTRGGVSSSQRQRRVLEPERLSPVKRLLFRILSQPKLVAMAIKEWKLIIREPQCRLILVLYGILYAGMLAAGVFLMPEDEQSFLMLTSGFTVVVFFVGLVFNTFSLERTGLRFMLTAPVHPIAMLVGKNLAYWTFISALMLGSMALQALLFRVGTSSLVLSFLSTQAMLVALLGVGNLVSVMAPYRLPSSGLVHQHRLSFGQVLRISFVGFVGMAGAATLVAGAHLFLLPAIASGHWKGSVEALLAGGCFLLGSYCLLTLAAALLLPLQAEKLLRAVAE